MATWMVYPTANAINVGQELDLKPMVTVSGSPADPVEVGDALVVEFPNNSRASGVVISNDHKKGIFEIDAVRWSVRRDGTEVWIVGAQIP